MNMLFNEPTSGGLEEDAENENSQHDITSSDVESCQSSRMTMTNKTKRLASRENTAVLGLKLALATILIVAAIITSVTTYRVTIQHEIKTFETQFAVEASRMVDNYYERAVNIIDTATISITTISERAEASQASWPFVSINPVNPFRDFMLELVHGASICFSPLLTNTTLVPWEKYASRVASAQKLSIHTSRNIDDGVWGLNEGNSSELERQREDNYFSPVWLVTPLSSRGEILMFDQFSEPRRREAFESVVKYGRPVMSKILDRQIEESIYRAHYRDPSSLSVFPIFKNGTNRPGTELVGFLSFELGWKNLYESFLWKEQRTMYYVVENSCGQQLTFQINQTDVEFVGEGALHDRGFEHLRRSTSALGFQEFLQRRNKASLSQTPGEPINDGQNGSCFYTLHFYPSESFRDSFLTRRPIHYTVAVATMFACTIIIFCVYDCLVERRQSVVMQTAVKSSAIVSSLFPPRIRDRLMSTSGNTTLLVEPRPKEHGNGDLASSGTGLIAKFPRMRLRSFLHNGVDSHAEGPKSAPPIAEMFSDVTVVFADIAGFTAWSSAREPHQVFKLLETLYSAFDVIANRLGGT